MISFQIEDRPDSNGIRIPTVVKRVTEADGHSSDEEWCTIQDLDRLFDCCVGRWGSNWNLEKVMTAIRECEFD